MLLIGGGHANLAVLADWKRHGIPTTRAAIVTASPHLRYSGMVPGWLAGEYEGDEGLVDIRSLASSAGIEYVEDRCTAIAPDARTIKLASGGVMHFGHCSIDAGGVGMSSRIFGHDHRIADVRPIDAFASHLVDWRANIAGMTNACARVAVIGGGAAGVELVFALRNQAAMPMQPAAVLVTGSPGLLPGFGRLVRGLVRSELAAQGIEVIEQDARLDRGELYAGGLSLEPLDLIVTALGSGAPDWPRAGGLATDTDGFIAVDRYQRSVSHPHIFAAGDIAIRQDRMVPHSGVHAVHTGPVLAINIRAVLSGAVPTESYTPRRASLYLLSAGNGRAIGSYGPFAFKGRWVAWLKRWIDKRWIASYARLADAV